MVPKAMVASGNRARFDRGFDEEDTSRDWNCPSCNERNFLKRNVCFKCQTPKPIAAADKEVIPRRTLSPHAGAREYIREARGSKPEEEEKKEESGSSSPWVA